MPHACNPASWEAKAEGCEFKASLRPTLPTKTLTYTSEGTLTVESGTRENEKVAVNEGFGGDRWNDTSFLEIVLKSALYLCEWDVIELYTLK